MGDGLKRAFQWTANSREVAKLGPSIKHGITLVQRVKSKFITRKEGLDPEIKSIDHYFEMDYMGASESEFEWGTVPEALRRMRMAAQMGEVGALPVRIKVAGKYLCWFVGRDSEYLLAKALFIDQLGLSGNCQHLKELSYIRNNYVDVGSPGALNGVALPSHYAKSRDDYSWYDGMMLHSSWYRL
jgi:hypothetical protein